MIRPRSPMGIGDGAPKKGIVAVAGLLCQPGPAAYLLTTIRLSESSTAPDP